MHHKGALPRIQLWKNKQLSSCAGKGLELECSQSECYERQFEGSYRSELTSQIYNRFLAVSAPGLQPGVSEHTLHRTSYEYCAR